MFPSHPAFDKKVTDVKELLARLAKNALASVNGSTCTTDQVNELRRMAEGISVIPEHTRETIGLVGDAGLGKLTQLFTATHLLMYFRQELLGELTLRLP